MTAIRCEISFAWRSALVLVGALLSVVLASAPATAAASWNSQEYDLYAGDYNGDGFDDILYVAVAANKMSGIALSDGTSVNQPWQAWGSSYLGIQWSARQYRVVVGDFNGDGKSDVLLQRTAAGNHFVLLADANGRFSAINQTIGQSHLGLEWSADRRRATAGDFDGNGRDEVLLQGADVGTNNTIVASSSGGTFGTLMQAWSDTAFGIRWQASRATVYVGDFNGDGRQDLLVQARPDFVLIDYEIPIPVPVYPPNYNAILYSQGGAMPFVDSFTTVARWSRFHNGVDWSPLISNLVVGDVTGDGVADIIVQSRSGSGASWLLAGTSSGPHTNPPQQVTSLIGIAGDSTRLITGAFGAGRIFVQSTLPGGGSYLGSLSGGVLSASTFDVDSAMPASGVVLYTYDALGRLTETYTVGGVGAGLQESFSYDAAGNRISVDVVGAP